VSPSAAKMTLWASLARLCTAMTCEPSGIGTPSGKLSGTAAWFGVALGVGRFGVSCSSGLRGVTCASTRSGILRGVATAPNPVRRSAIFGGGSGALDPHVHELNGNRLTATAARVIHRRSITPRVLLDLKIFIYTDPGPAAKAVRVERPRS